MINYKKNNENIKKKIQKVVLCYEGITNTLYMYIANMYIANKF